MAATATKAIAISILKTVIHPPPPRASIWSRRLEPDQEDKGTSLRKAAALAAQRSGQEDIATFTLTFF